MDAGDSSNFSQPPSAFILLPSQEETQQESQAEDQMRRMLTKLPALQPPQTHEKPKPTLHIDLGETSTEEDNKKASRVYVEDSEDTDQKCKESVETSDVVSESMAEDEITVIEKKNKDDSDMIADTEVSCSSPVEPDRSLEEVVLDKSRSQSSSPSNESSFVSKDRSNLGSYDQCELYRTQSGHAHGQRFPLFQSSQEDVFGGDGEDDDQLISTPAEHIGSLHLSLKPMLVPETVDEQESEVPMSPPLIIPASPTDQEPTEEEYDANAVNTLADYSKGFDYSSSSSSSKHSADKTVIERPPTPSSEHQGRITPTEDQEFNMRPVPTLAGDVEQSQEPESLHLHLSMSHPSESSSAYQQIISPERNSESLEIIEYVTETPRKRPPEEASTNQSEETENQSESRVIIVSTPRTKAPPVLPREVTKTPEDVIIIDSGTGDVPDGEEEQLALHLSPSQGDKQLVHSKPPKSSQVVLTDTSERNKDQSIQTSKSSSGDRYSEDFHLTLPKDGDLLHPVKEGVVSVEPTEMRQESEETMGRTEDSERTVERFDLPKSPTLTLSMIQTESEVVPEPVFRLEKPEIRSGDVEGSEAVQEEDVFRRAKVKQSRKHWKYVQEEDSHSPSADSRKAVVSYKGNDDDYISPRQPPTKTQAPDDADFNVEENRKSQQVTVTESNDNTLSYNADTVENTGKHNENLPAVSQDTEIEVLEAIPLAMVEDHGSLVQEPHGSLVQEPSQEIIDKLKTPKRPRTPQGSLPGSQPGKSPNVQKILKAYTDIIYKQASPRQRSASVDITNLSRLEAKALTRRYSQDVRKPNSSPMAKGTGTQFEKLEILTELPIVTGKPDPLFGETGLPVSPDSASVSPKSGAISPKSGAVSPKAGAISPKDGSWMSARKGNPDIISDSGTKQKKNCDSPSSNPPKSPKGIDIVELSQELLQSFRKSKRHRRESGHKKEGKHNSDKHNDDGKHVQTNISENIIVSTVSSPEVTTNINLLTSPPLKSVISSQKDADVNPHTTPSRPTGLENQYLSGLPTPSQEQNRTALPEAHSVISLQKSTPDAMTPKFGGGSTGKADRHHKTKKLMSSTERLKRRASVESNTSAHMTTGSFVSSTQKLLKETSIEPLSTASGTQALGNDPYSFQLSQSQRETRISPRLKRYTSSSFERTPTSTRKRRKLMYKKSGVKKQKMSDEASSHGKSSKVETKEAKNLKSPNSQGSDVTVTTTGSSVSIPSSISQSDPARQTVLTPSGSSSKSSTGAAGTLKRLSIEPLTDTLPLQTEDDNYQRVTIETNIIKSYVMQTEIKRRVIGSQGQILESSTDIQKGEPVIVEDTTQKKVQVVYVPSPSRSVSSLTSGDLADVSSSWSRSGSSSLGSKVSITGGSFDQSQKSPDPFLPPERRLSRSDSHQRSQSGLVTRKSLDHTDAHQGSQTGLVGQRSLGNPDAQEGSQIGLGSKQRSIDLLDSQAGKDERASQNGRRQSEFAEPLPSTSKQNDSAKKDTPASRTGTPNNTSKPPSTGVTPLVPSNIAIPSDTDGSDVGTPLGSTINKTGSRIYSRTISIESPRPVESAKRSSPKASDSLFSSTEEKGDNLEPIQTRRRSSGTSDGSLIPAGQKRQPVRVVSTDGQKTEKSGSSSDDISPEIPYQDQAVSSSGAVENTDIVPSTGEPGSRIIAKWKDGFFYPGTVKGKDRYGRFQIRFDDGDSLTVKAEFVLLVEKLPVGQSVMVLTKEGYFESGMISQQKTSAYMIEADTGSSGLYSHSEVILTADQANCLITDRGNEIMIEKPGQQLPPANVGDVSLENLLDGPRRSAKKSAPETKVKAEEKGEGQGSKSRKRKMEALQPKATSTPTPKGKMESESSPKKRKAATATKLTESPITGATSSPITTRKSPRKGARVGLFSGDLGPLPTKKIFKGMMFILTNVDKTAEQRQQERQLMKDSSLETSTDESAIEDEVSVAFDKNHLKAQIEAGGGKVLDNFDIQQVEGCKKCFLVSSTYQRTIKYLQCLACGIVCVAHSWVVNSCKEDQLLDHKSYILPAGISLEKKKLIECKKSKTDVLVGVKAHVSSKNSKFCESWSDILKLAKCTVLSKPNYRELDVIVTDSDCTQTMERQADSHTVPLVSTEWIIQSLVNGKPMKFDGHPRYKHDFII